MKKEELSTLIQDLAVTIEKNKKPQKVRGSSIVKRKYQIRENNNNKFRRMILDI